VEVKQKCFNQNGSLLPSYLPMLSQLGLSSTNALEMSKEI